MKTKTKVIRCKKKRKKLKNHPLRIWLNIFFTVFFLFCFSSHYTRTHTKRERTITDDDDDDVI